MKTTKYIYIGVLASAFLLGSCSDDFLKVENPSGEPLDEYYTTDAHLQESVTAAYDPLHWPDWDGTAYNALNIDAEIMGDDFYPGGSSITDNQHWHKLFNFEGDGNNTLTTLWGDFYSGIKRCNDVLTYCAYDANKGNSNLPTYIEQARLLRVYYYNILWHYYGDIPFYLTNLSSPYQADQISADKVYENLIAELEDILKNNVLPMRWDDANAGRVSKAFAYMLYAELVMYQNDTQRYPQALAYMKEIIKSEKYRLMSNFADIWKESGEWGSESIFEINYQDDQAGRDWQTSKSAGGTVLPTLISPNGWQGGDGWSAGQDGWGFLPMRVETYNMYENGDQRRDATCWDVRSLLGTDKDYKARYQDTHLWLAKYRPMDDNSKDCPTSKNLNYNNNLRVYRYAETLLNAAELTLATGGSNGEATGYLNEVHRRAGLPAMTSITEDDILNERHLEFVGEGKRYFDLVRTGKAATTLVAIPGTDRTNSWTPNKKHVPLAQSELDNDPKLHQNDYTK